MLLLRAGDDRKGQSELAIAAIERGRFRTLVARIEHHLGIGAADMLDLGDGVGRTGLDRFLVDDLILALAAPSRKVLARNCAIPEVSVKMAAVLYFFWV